jgi:hypothetical protein
MKQTLNEQVNRIKTIMGCSGTLNEDDTNCVDIESEQGTQMVNTLASSIKTLGLSNDDITYSDTASPEVAETKKKITICVDGGIDEKIIKLKLSEMIAELEGNNDFQKKIYDDEIEYLIQKRKDLK